MQKGRTIIVGAGGFGRELINWAGDCHAAGLIPAVAGLLDDDPAALESYHYGIDLLGRSDDYVPVAGDQLLMAIGTPTIKKYVTQILEAKGGRFVSMVHPTAVVAGSARIGEGAVLCPLSIVSADATVGRLVAVNALTSIGHDVTIGDYSTLSAHVDLTGAVTVGEGVMIGSGAKVLPRVRIGTGATIGAGATVYRSVPPGRSVFAAPAKLLRTVQADNTASL